MKQRLDQAMVMRGLVPTRSQAESFIKLGEVTVDGKAVTKPGFFVPEAADIVLKAKEQYVSRAALKLASVAAKLKLDFKGKVILDVGSSTGGFTEYALAHGARRAIAVEVGTNQMHAKLRSDLRIELHEQTDIRSVRLTGQAGDDAVPPNAAAAEPPTVFIEVPDLVLVDVSFISLREILPHVATLCGPQTQVAAMFKPQFEAGEQFKHKGVIKNDRLRRELLKDFETWVQKRFVIIDKADSGVAGARGNQERFYLLRQGR